MQNLPYPSSSLTLSVDQLRQLLTALVRTPEATCRAELDRVHEAIAVVVQALTASSSSSCSLDASDTELLRSYMQMVTDRKARPSGIDLSESASPEGDAGADQVLRPRHRETLEWLLTGATEKEIAAGLGLSVHTVHQYVKAIYRRFGVTSRAQLMASRLRNGTTPHTC